MFITARYDERRGQWIYTLKGLTRAYTSKWFWIDLVRRLDTKSRFAGLWGLVLPLPVVVASVCLGGAFASFHGTIALISPRCLFVLLRHSTR